MEIKWKNRRSGFASRLTSSLLVFALTLGLIAVTPGLNGAVRAVNLEDDCSLKVAPAGSNDLEMLADLTKANVIVDLYKVADAEPVSGYDTYTYSFYDEYEDLKGIYDADPNNAEWMQMAQKAAGYVRDNQANGLTPVASGKITDSGYAEISGLKSGLYLLIARGEDIEEYWTTVKQDSSSEDGEESAEAVEGIATRAHSDRYEYTYSPQMISLPGKEGNNTAGNNGDWLYNMDASLKPQQSLRYGSLEIVKTLLNYEVKDPATFIFEVTAVLNGETVFRDNVSLTFDEGDETGQKRALLENRIPVGAEVTVEEVYSGAVYELTSSPTQTTIIEANNIVSVAFTNDYNETNHGGGSVTNSFNQSENGWHLQQIYDDGRVEEQGNE